MTNPQFVALLVGQIITVGLSATFVKIALDARKDADEEIKNMKKRTNKVIAKMANALEEYEV